MLRTYPILQAKKSKPFLQFCKTLSSPQSRVCVAYWTLLMGEIMMCGNLVRRKLWKGASWMAGGRLAFCPFCPPQIGRCLPSRKPNPQLMAWCTHWGGQADGWWLMPRRSQPVQLLEYQIESVEYPSANLTNRVNPLFCWRLLWLIWPPCSWFLSSTLGSLTANCPLVIGDFWWAWRVDWMQIFRRKCLGLGGGERESTTSS